MCAYKQVAISDGLSTGICQKWLWINKRREEILHAVRHDDYVVNREAKTYQDVQLTDVSEFSGDLAINFYQW
jgi:hypothetical protein